MTGEDCQKPAKSQMTENSIGIIKRASMKKAPKPVEQFVELGLIRKSRVSKTYLCRHILTGINVQIEKFSYSATTFANYRPPEITTLMINRKILANISTMQRTLACLEGKGYTWFVQEDVGGQNVVEFVDEAPLPLAQAKYLFFLFVQTVINIHSNCLCVRDWNPNHFVCSGSMIKFIDYSILCRSQTQSNAEGISWIGDVRWMAPEMIFGEEYNLVSCDMWALGLILYLFTHGRPLMMIDDNRDLYQQFKHFKLELAPDLDANAADLIQSLLTLDAGARPPAEALLDHRFLLPSIPFPLVHMPVELDPRVAEWISFFGYNPQTALADARAGVVREGLLYFCLATLAVERGRAPPEVVAIERPDKADPHFYILPPTLAVAKSDPPPAPSTAPNTDRRTARAKSRMEQLHKLLGVTTSRFQDQGITITHVESFKRKDVEQY